MLIDPCHYVRFLLVLIATEQTADQWAGLVDAADAIPLFFHIKDTASSVTIQHPISFVIRRILARAVVAHFCPEDFDERFTSGVSRSGLNNQVLATIPTSTRIEDRFILFDAVLTFVGLMFAVFIEIVAVESVGLFDLNSENTFTVKYLSSF